MGYTQLKPIRPRRDNSVDISNKVRVSFPKVKGSVRLHIEFGRFVMQKLGVKSGDRFAVWIDDENPLVWLLKKDTDPHNSWKVVSLNPNNANSNFAMRLTWNKPIPGRCDHTLRYASFDLHEGGLRIFLPGHTFSEKE